MKGVLLSSSNKNGKKVTMGGFSLHYFLLPVRSGLLGFGSFFAILIISKYLGYLIGSLNEFKIDFEDITLSMLGFVLVFLIKFLENFKEKESTK